MDHEFSWHPGIGDPTIGGWITVALYLLTSLSCCRTTVFVDRRDRTDVHVWLTISVVFLFLGINKQLDLQSAITEIGRMIALASGWYQSRRIVQIDFILGVAAVCLTTIPVVIYWARKFPIQTTVGLVGSTLVLSYVMIRAASFHHFDHFISSRYLGFKWNWILEITGIAVVLVASEWRRARVYQQSPKRIAN